MKKLLSLPPNAVMDYYLLHNRGRGEWFCTSDPRERRLGSGSGTTWLLEECFREEAPGIDFMEWLRGEKRILVHAGGQSRRLPAYAVAGKIGLPVPVFRWQLATVCLLRAGILLMCWIGCCRSLR